MGVDMELLESGKKKLRIQNDPDIHVDEARGLRRVSIGSITVMLLWTFEQTEKDMAF